MIIEYWSERKRPWTNLICHPVINPGGPRKTAESVSLHIEFTGLRSEPSTSYVRQGDFKRKMRLLRSCLTCYCTIVYQEGRRYKEPRLSWAATYGLVMLDHVTLRFVSRTAGCTSFAIVSFYYHSALSVTCEDNGGVSGNDGCLRLRVLVLVPKVRKLEDAGWLC
jgi:hypothetical protein